MENNNVSFFNVSSVYNKILQGTLQASKHYRTMDNIIAKICSKIIGVKQRDLNVSYNQQIGRQLWQLNFLCCLLSVTSC